MSSSSHHNDFSGETVPNSLLSTNSTLPGTAPISGSGGDNSHATLSPSHPLVQLHSAASSQRSITGLDEESPLLSISSGPMQDILEGLQNRENLSRSQDAQLELIDMNASSNFAGVTPTTGSSTTTDRSFSSPLHVMEDGSHSLSSSSYISPQNLQPSAPTVLETRPARRRRLSRNRHHRGPGDTTASSSSSNPNNVLHTPANHSARRVLRQNELNALHGNSNGNASNNSLRASLDAGMAAVQRWIRARSSSNSAASEPSSGRSVTWSVQPESGSEVISLSSRSAGATVGHVGGAEEESFGGHRSLTHVRHPTIFEEDEDALGRQRALSESDAVRIRDFFRSMRGGHTRRRRRSGAHENTARQLSSSAAAALYTTTSTSHLNNNNLETERHTSTNRGHVLPPTDFLSASPGTTSLRARSVTDGGLDSFRSMDFFETTGQPVMEEHSSVSTSQSEGTGEDPEQQARLRWIQINRRFQFVITAVALLFSLLLFAILICWVVLTSAYVVCFDKSCDVPLKPYFWLVTFQLVLDVFRTDIMRFVFNWNSSSSQRIPSRVIVYNIAYLIYALLVLRLGIRSVFANHGTSCRVTAPELFNASTAFVTLSIGAWGTIICGYLLPFFVVAALLTCNGYNPQQGADGTTQAVFPAAYATTGAPPGTIELLHVLRAEDIAEDCPRECCICMEPLSQKTVVETSCKHVFHKQCCREWLRQARTCPVCRTDIPSAYGSALETGDAPVNAASESTRIPIGPTGRPVVGLWQVLRRQSISFGGSNGSDHRTDNEHE